MFAATVGQSNSIDASTPPADLPIVERRAVSGAVERLLLHRQANEELSAELIQMLIALDRLEHVDPLVIFVNICRFPRILNRIPALRSPTLYRHREGREGLALLSRLITAVDDGRSRLIEAVDDGRQDSSAPDARNKEFEELCRAIDPEMIGLMDELDGLSEYTLQFLRRLVPVLRDDTWEDGEDRF
jgi:hypothetical protein